MSIHDFGTGVRYAAGRGLKDTLLKMLKIKIMDIERRMNLERVSARACEVVPRPWW